ILLAAPLLARCGQVTLPPPGGDVIGRRRLDTHFIALEQLGASFTHGKMIDMRVAGFRGADVFLDEPSVTATENALVAASAASGTTVLRNAASEPHVQDLAKFLIALGAEIEGVGTNTMTIHGGRRIVTATQCDGLILMHEKMFESRMFFVDKLSTMGARIVLCDPHRALVNGPSRLRGAFLESPDIRAGMAMLLAALCAEGTSFINNV